MDADALYQDVYDKYTKYINPNLARLMGFAGFGVEMTGEGCYIFDHEGRKYLDCLGGYGCFTFGHRNPKIVGAVRDQLDHLALSGKAFFSKQAADLAEKLAHMTPGDLQITFFSNSGTESVEAALKFAKATTGRMKIVSTNGSYHGKTIGALSTTGREKYRKKFEPLMPGVSFVEYGDIKALSTAIDDQTACFIVEPIQGEGGIIVPPDGYLKAAREACDKHGALLIFDEVQSGLGRAGYVFACNHEGVAPDIMTLAKALGGGVIPLGATIFTQAIYDKVFGDNPMAHTSTFGGNPLACAAGLAAMEVLETGGIVENSKVMGERMLAGFQAIKDKFPDLMKEVRGRGLMIGVEFTMDEVGEVVVAQLMKRGVCVAYALNNPRVLRFEPPLVINADQVDFALQAFEESLQETSDLLAVLV
ncbi:MAG: aminotransferase class III-fold pyridoxal phosphate-dependent enzyme [Armatimonadetes bacterium]|nr:aminotransferase class III-fold pyridoxal phosphate-dependent enzyme [Armatimonadota bacterium]